MLQNRVYQWWFQVAMGVLILFYGVSAKADAPIKRTQAPAYFRVILGEIEVTALLDENSPWPENVDNLFPSLSADQRRALHSTTHLQPKYDFSTIAFLVNTGKKLILIDAGGNGSGPGYGQLFPHLKAAGYTAEQVDEIYITHMHPDHIGGLLMGDQIAFPNATVFADAHELPQWENAAAKNNATAKSIVQKIAPYIRAKRFQTFNGDTQFSSGLRAIASHGHTDGHSFYSIESQGQKMVFWGDFVVNDKVQLEMPELAPPGEKDVKTGIALRQREYSDASKKAYLIAGAHFAFPGIGRIRDLGGKYIWVPIDYASIPAKPNLPVTAN